MVIIHSRFVFRVFLPFFTTVLSGSSRKAHGEEASVEAVLFCLTLDLWLSGIDARCLGDGLHIVLRPAQVAA